MNQRVSPPSLRAFKRDGKLVIEIDEHRFGTDAIAQLTMNGCTCRPRASSPTAVSREVFCGAILDSAALLIVAHNDPSGDPAPSPADITVTRMLCEAAKVLEVELMDPTIVGDVKADPLARGTHPVREAGLL